MDKHISFALTLVALLVTFLPIKAEDIPPLPPAIEADGRLGTCFSYYDNGSRAPQAYAAGSRWDRFDFRWDAIQKSLDSFDAAGHHNIVDNIDRPNHMDVVGILWATPTWAACSSVASRKDIARFQAALPAGDPGHASISADPGSRLPCGLDLAWDDPANTWGQYVFRVVTEFKDTVHVWELWNEADRPWFWAGTAAQYAQILKVGYQAVKAADPDATVLFGGLAYWGNTDFHKTVLDHLRATDPQTLANHGYFDVMSLHLYSNVYHNHDIAGQVMQEVQDRVGWHPLWLTETGVPIWDEKAGDPAPYEATAEEAANYVIQGYAEARAAGVDKFFFFRLHDEGMDQLFGLTRNDYTLRPSYVAYQVAARYLRGENQITGPWRGVTERVTFLGTPNGRIDVLWNTTATTTTTAHPAILPTATLVDKRGVTQTLAAVNGVYTLTLPAATANRYHPEALYMIGGDPLLLIQTDVETPTSALRPLYPQTYTNTLTLTWDVTDTVSGYWYAEIQRAPTATGPWEAAAGWGQTNDVTHTAVSLPYTPGVYQPWYFRARARDRVGNWEPWPAAAEISSDFAMSRTVALTVALEDSSQTIIPPGPDATLRWLAPDNAIISQTVGNYVVIIEGASLLYGTPWVVSATVSVGLHHLAIARPGFLPATESFWVLPEAGDQHTAITYKLRPIHAQLYLPLTLRSAQR